MDAGGRVAAYDSRRPSRYSLAERIRSRIPLGLSVEETRGRVNAEVAHLRRHGSINAVLFYASGVVFALIVGFRVLLMWERTYLQKRPAPDEPHPMPGAS